MKAGTHAPDGTPAPLRMALPLWLAAGLCACQTAGAAPPASQATAVVELFTSEGCSSCPPAERVFERVVTDARRGGRRIVALAFHVDYWDDLGWPDRFASPRFTDRQRAYAGAFGESGLYTPEMVVGGVDHFVGSDAAAAERSVGAALAREPGALVTARVRRIAPDRVSVHTEVAAPSRARSLAGADLVLAVIQLTARVDVTAGENAGRSLTHTEVVRVLETHPLQGATALDAVVTLPWTPIPGDAAVVALVEAGPRAILGADSAELP